mgnify:FL=1
MEVLIGVTGRNKMDTKLLIASPRSGSTWFIDSYLDKPSNYIGEYFNKDWLYWIKRRNHKHLLEMFDRLDEDNLVSKTKFLESEIKNDRHYCIKLFPSQIYHWEDHREWLYNFYKDKNVFYLQRQNKWEQFLSYTYQQKTGWEHPNPKTSEMNKIKKQKIEINKSDVELWLDINNRDNSLDLSKFNNLKTFNYEAMNSSTEYAKMRDYIDYESVIENAREYKWMIL